MNEADLVRQAREKLDDAKASKITARARQALAMAESLLNELENRITARVVGPPNDLPRLRLRCEVLEAQRDEERRSHLRTLETLSDARAHHAKSLSEVEAALHDAVRTMRENIGAHLELRRRVRAIFDTHPAREWGAFDCDMMHEAMTESMRSLEESYRASIGAMSDEAKAKRERWIFRRGISVATGDLCGADDEQCDREIGRCPL